MRYIFISLNTKTQQMDLNRIEELIRAKVQTGASYAPQQSQIRWLDRKMRGWVGGTTGYIDQDSFVDHCLVDLTLVGCRNILIELFDKYKETDGEECDLVDVEMFSNTIMSTSTQKQSDELRRSMGAIY